VRRAYGGSSGDFLTDARGNVESGGTGTVWTAQTDGTQITDLLTADGAACTTISASASPEGMIQFQGPDDGTTVLWVDFGTGTRVKMVATDGMTVLESFTVAGLPAAASYPRRLIYVSNGTSNKRLAVSDGTNWRFPDGNVVT
jgi:hypothetical protein